MEQLKHECGVAMIRLLKPLDYYEKKYGSWAYGFNKLYLMMEKQHNRGQEGAGIASVNLNNKPGTEYMFREKAEGKNAITEIFSRVTEEMKGELLMGHLRYSTTGKSGLTFVHPFLRRNNWRAKNLCLCGNFNMTNIDEVFDFLTAQGQSPRIYGDSYITLELMGHRLDREVERLYQEATAQGLTGIDITNYIDNHIEMANVLRTTMQHYDGGFVMCGLTGSGEMFSVRDPWGIRPAFYYRDDEIIALASERPVLQTTFDIDSNDVHELLPGQALIVHKNGKSRLEQIMPAQKLSACSFERIYFSRGSDCDIYQERKRLGEQLTQPILKAIDGDVTHSVFSYIPNTAEVAFYGMTDGFRKLHGDVRTEKVVWKDIKLRTFITDNSERNDLAAHVYDISYGSLQAGVDNLVIIDDSIVRGTTLKESIFKILDRLLPKKIVMVSSSPQIRYPDYYGIDMARLEEFCAFRATMALIEERGMWQLVNDTYLACKRELTKPKEEMQNCVRAVYEPFTVDEINKKIVEMLRPADMQAPIELVFQSIEGLHKACPNHPGDWYFTGHYPTPGGVRLVNQAFINYVDKVTKK
ncbi:amidophosphoribosyltransferase [Xylanibacter ruminicola]|uniref:amidophosphoribosyltransferase n=1 Tax=Xylanibacter ruminicola TaxID=839 RepID=UPI00048CAD31|nr:amidophosphoribosyltransferase [Xylanibacter ruminicola]